MLHRIESVTSAQMRLQLGDAYADAKLGLAAVKVRTGDIQGAREILHAALDPGPSTLGQFTHSTVLLQLAKLEQSQTKAPADPEHDQAVHFYLEAIAALHKDEDVNGEVSARLRLVQYLAIGTVATGINTQSPHATLSPTALAMAREQLTLARTAAKSVELADAGWRIQYLQGILDQNAGDSTAATQAYSSAVDALDKIRAGLSQQEERESFIDSDAVQDLYRRQIALLTEAGDHERAWEFLERDKARTFLESLHGRRFAPAHTSATTVKVAPGPLRKTPDPLS